jgi:hypothetical protein
MSNIEGRNYLIIIYKMNYSPGVKANTRNYFGRKTLNKIPLSVKAVVFWAPDQSGSDSTNRKSFFFLIFLLMSRATYRNNSPITIKTEGRK